MQFAKRAGKGYEGAHSRLLDAGGNANNSHTHDMQTAETEVPCARKEIKLSPKQERNFWRKVAKNGPTMPHMNTPCWLWNARKDASGYGRFMASGRLLSTHRIAWVLVNGQIPHDGSYHGICVCHKCDVKSCCRFDHLFLGTQADNVADRESKKRGNQPKGDANGTRKHPERLARGKSHGTKLHPESVPRGDHHHSRLHPERMARGNANGSRLHPERMRRGESNSSSKLNAVQVIEIRALYVAGNTKKVIAAQFGVSQTSIHRIVIRKLWRHV